MPLLCLDDMQMKLSDLVLLFATTPMGKNRSAPHITVAMYPTMCAVLLEMTKFACVHACVRFDA